MIAPQLSIARSSANILLTWLAPSAYSLQATTNLAATNWTPITPSIVVTNGLNAVTFGSTNATRFFRLAKP